MEDIRISLSEEDFQTLVRGKVVEKNEGKAFVRVRVCLNDIGFRRMKQLIDEVVAETRRKED